MRVWPASTDAAARLKPDHQVRHHTLLRRLAHRSIGEGDRAARVLADRGLTFGTSVSDEKNHRPLGRKFFSRTSRGLPGPFGARCRSVRHVCLARRLCTDFSSSASLCRSTSRKMSERLEIDEAQVAGRRALDEGRLRQLRRGPGPAPGRGRHPGGGGGPRTGRTGTGWACRARVQACPSSGRRSRRPLQRQSDL
jgi:hypothetical protein